MMTCVEQNLSPCRQKRWNDLVYVKIHEVKMNPVSDDVDVNYDSDTVYFSDSRPANCLAHHWQPITPGSSNGLVGANFRFAE